MCPEDFGYGGMLGNYLLDKLEDNVENLSIVFDEIYLADTSVVINNII